MLTPACFYRRSTSPATAVVSAYFVDDLMRYFYRQLAKPRDGKIFLSLVAPIFTVRLAVRFAWMSFESSAEGEAETTLRFKSLNLHAQAVPYVNRIVDSVL